MNKSLKVMLWDKEVGRLSWDNKKNLSYFTFNPDFYDSNWDVAPLIASTKDFRSRMPIYGETERIYQKLPPFLADSLPDAWGNQLFECWRTGNKIPNSNITPLDKLSFIGKRGMGALEFEPEVENTTNKNNIDVQSLVNLAQKIFVERENVHILPEESLTLQALIAVGTSAGGRQPKAVIAINRATGEIRSGQIAGLEGYDYCILKFGDDERSSAELEMTYFQIARMAGIHMMESKLRKFDGKNHFLTKRFDRDGNKKLHTQTLAALYPEADSYEKLLWVCRKMHLSELEIEEIYRRMVFNFLANNTDDHNKNFSFIMDQNGHWQLSPAYDVTYIFNYGGYQPQEEHCITIGGKLCDVTKQDILTFAVDNGIRKAESIIQEVATAITSFRILAEKNGVKEQWIGRIENCLAKHLADWGVTSLTTQHGIYTDTFGHVINDASIEEAYRGNYHLFATIDGTTYKYIIRSGTTEHRTISDLGIINISSEMLHELVEKYLIPKAERKH